MLKVSSIFLVAILIGPACGTSDDDEESTTGNSATALTELSTQETLGSSASALSSAGTLLVDSSGSGLLLQDETVSSTDTKCTNYGRAWDNSEETVKGAGDEDFAVDSFRCMLTIDGGSDTPIGLINQWAFIFCMLEDELGEEVTFPETAATETLSVNPANASDTCKALTAGNIKDEDMDISIDLTTQDISSGDTGFQKKMTIDPGFFSVEVYLATSADRLAMHISESNEDSKGVASIMIDRSVGVMNYETAVYDTEVSDLVSHRRVKVSGTLDEDLSFTSVDAIQGIDVVCHTQGCTQGDGYTGATVNGLIPDQIRYTEHWYQSSSDTKCAYGNQTLESGCTNDSVGCTGESCTADPISFYTDLSGQTNNFFDAASYLSYIEDTTPTPLCFNTVDTSVAPSTATFENCTIESDAE